MGFSGPVHWRICSVMPGLHKMPVTPHPCSDSQNISRQMSLEMETARWPRGGDSQWCICLIKNELDGEYSRWIWFQRDSRGYQKVSLLEGGPLESSAAQES